LTNYTSSVLYNERKKVPYIVNLPLDRFLGEPMARIPVEEVERLKTEVSVQRLAEARGVAFKKHGSDLIGRCPFHDDKTPSLVVTSEKNLRHCLGACQAGGSVIDWVMKAEGVSFRHAIELLQNDYQPVAGIKSASFFGVQYGLPAVLSDLPGGTFSLIGAFQTGNAYYNGNYFQASQAGGATLGGIALAELLGAYGLSLGGPWGGAAGVVVGGLLGTGPNS
jgi:CHC2 zinc finger